MFNAIKGYIEDYEVSLIYLFSFTQFIIATTILAHVTTPYWYPALAGFVALVASAIWNFSAKFGVALLSLVLTASFVAFVAKLRAEDYQGALLALFFTFILTLALLYSIVQ